MTALKLSINAILNLWLMTVVSDRLINLAKDKQLFYGGIEIQL